MSTLISDILEREYMGINGETKKLKDIINPERDTYVLNESKIVFKKEATLKLRQHVGAVFLKPEFVERPSAFNDKEYVIICTVRFPDGEESFEIGCANNLNTDSFSRKIKPIMAFKRGCARAFLSSNRIGLFEVYDEDESEDFKKNPNQNRNVKPIMENQEEMNPETEKTNPATAFPTSESLFLPLSDPKYPGKHIVDDVLKIHMDFDYFDEIIRLYPDNDNYSIAISVIKKKNEEKKLKKTKEPITESTEVQAINESIVTESEEKNERDTSEENKETTIEESNSTTQQTTENTSELPTQTTTEETPELPPGEKSTVEEQTHASTDLNENQDEENLEINERKLSDAEAFLNSL